jgi:hypothetical protein
MSQDVEGILLLEKLREFLTDDGIFKSADSAVSTRIFKMEPRYPNHQLFKCKGTIIEMRFGSTRRFRMRSLSNNKQDSSDSVGFQSWSAPTSLGNVGKLGH